MVHCQPDRTSPWSPTTNSRLDLATLIPLDVRTRVCALTDNTLICNISSRLQQELPNCEERCEQQTTTVLPGYTNLYTFMDHGTASLPHTFIFGFHAIGQWNQHFSAAHDLFMAFLPSSSLWHNVPTETANIHTASYLVPFSNYMTAWRPTSFLMRGSIEQSYTIPQLLRRRCLNFLATFPSSIAISDVFGEYTFSKTASPSTRLLKGALQEVREKCFCTWRPIFMKMYGFYLLRLVKPSWI